MYVCLCRDEVALHRLAQSKSKQKDGQGALCVLVEDVDALYAEFTGRDGNHVSFGMQIKG